MKFVLTGLLSIACSGVLACAPEAAARLDAIRSLYADPDLARYVCIDNGECAIHAFASQLEVKPVSLGPGAPTAIQIEPMRQGHQYFSAVFLLDQCRYQMVFAPDTTLSDVRLLKQQKNNFNILRAAELDSTEAWKEYDFAYDPAARQGSENPSGQVRVTAQLPTGTLYALMRCALLAAAICVPAAAYESENAVPLTLGLEAGKAVVEKIVVKLDGREVTVSTTLKNSEGRASRIGWYAVTPQFSMLGDGEEHLDKSFADIGARFNGQARKPATYRRGYFMGRDITQELAKTGLPPLPDLQVDQKKRNRLTPVQGVRPEQWQGYASYAWNETLPATSSAQIEVRYRALPQFAVVDLDSALFTQAIQQHCGNPEAVRRRLLAVAGAATQVMVERYDVPLSYMLQQDVRLEIVQPPANWQRAHPLVSLACGLDNAGQVASVAGTVSNANLALSVLVVSALPDVNVTEAQRHGR